MKYAPKKVFIKENEVFIEITNEEHESRKATDEQYAKRWFIPLQGCLLEVDEQFYNEYYKEYERNKYLAALDRKNKVLSIEAFDSDDDNGVDFIVDEDEDVERQVTDKLMAEHIRYIVSLLPSDERELIESLYFKGYSERQWSKISGIPQRTVCYRKNVILQKLKKILKN